MKSSTALSLLAITALSLSTAVFAAGPAGGRAAAKGTGTTSRIHTPGTGLATGTTPTATRSGASGQGSGAAQGAHGAGGSGRGVHTPGTGLVPTAPTP